MPRLLSGSTLRRGGSGEFIDLKGAQPQLPPTPTTSTGYTLVTDSLLRSEYRSSLGNLQFNQGEIYSNLPNQDIKLISTSGGVVRVFGGFTAVGITTATLTIDGGVGISDNLYTANDINVNGLTIGRGYEGQNNIVIRGAAETPLNDFDNGQESIAIGYDTLLGLDTANRVIAIGRFALSSGTNLTRSIAIGDSALKNIGVYHRLPYATITNATKTNPVVVTAPNHNFSSGTNIILDGIIGMTELNNNNYYVWVENTNTFKLYSDINLNVPVDGTGYTTYSSSGTAYLSTVYDDNIAIGTNAAENLINGQQNFFFGTNIARNLTTGSYNIFMGHEVGNNMKSGNANISIGGDNLVNGLNNQINIGAAWYYNGAGYTQFNSDFGVGIGTNSTGTTSGAVKVAGGVGITEELNVGGLTHIYNGMIVDYLITGTITTATNIAGGALGSIPYQLDNGITDLLPIGALDTILYSDGTTATWTPISSLTSGVATNADNIFVNTVVTGTTYYIAGVENLGDYSPVDADAKLTYVTTATTTSSYFVSGTNLLNVPGSIYSQDGNPQENNLLYTPKVTISATAPLNPRVGDFWIDPTYGVELQYINDGGNRIWVQFTTL
jgi:hypothetical protein